MYSTGLVRCRECEYVAIEEGQHDNFTGLGCPHCFQRTCDSAPERERPPDCLQGGPTATVDEDSKDVFQTEMVAN